MNTAKLLIITGNGKSGKSRRLTFMANHDRNGVYLGPSLGNGDYGTRSQSRTLPLDESTPYILTKDGLPGAAEILRKYPNTKNIFVDEAQHLYPDGIETKDAILGYLDQGFNVAACGVFHNRENYDILLDRACKIIFCVGGIINMDNSDPKEVEERQSRIDFYLNKYADKTKFFSENEYLDILQAFRAKLK